MNKKPGLASRSIATTVLTRVIDDARGLDGLLDTRHGPAGLRDLSSADQSLVRAICVAAMRNRGVIDHVLGKMLDRPLPKGARHLSHTLHVALSQILFLDVPDSAAVDLAVTALKEDKRSARFASLANAILRRASREKEGILQNLDPAQAAELNLAPWLRKRIRKSYGKTRLPLIAQQHMLEPSLDITVKENPAEWADKLGGVHLFANSIRVIIEGRIEEWEGYEEGAWWVQDAAAHLPANLMGDIKGMSVADLCAAPGGKTAQLVAQGAHVTALEASADRLKRLEQNLERLKLKANCVHGNMMEWEPEAPFDAILLDAPCSSTGTIRRHPDVQWTKNEQTVEGLAQLQYDMINRAAMFLKPGGTLVFANCSIDRTEGEDVFAKICANNTDLIADPFGQNEIFDIPEILTGQGTVRTLPCHLQDVTPPHATTADPKRFTGMDGFFAARFKKAS